MERDYNRNYYHGGLGAEDNRRNFDRDTRDGDFGRDYENRYRGRSNNYDRNERSYRHQDYDMERNYYDNTGNSSHRLDDIRQGYGFPSFRREDDYGNELDNMQRERQAQQRQSYSNTSRMTGYSGAAFGGANYSSNGDFGGSDDYGAMSGHDDAAEDYASWSGYGGGHGTQQYSREPQRHANTHRQGGRYDDRYRRSTPNEYYRQDHEEKQRFRW